MNTTPGQKVLDHYLHLLQSTRVAGRSLPVAFFTAMGALDPGGDSAPADSENATRLSDPRTARDLYLDLMIQVSVAIAEKLIDPEQGVEYWRALGITSPEDLLACVAVVLYLRRNSPVLGDLAEKLPDFLAEERPEDTEVDSPEDLAEESPAEAEAGQSKKDWLKRERGKILKALRELLFREPAIAFLALGNEEAHYAPGARRIGIYGYSHYAREILLFSLFGQQCQASLFSAIRDHWASVRNQNSFLLEQSDPNCLNLLRGVFSALQEVLHKIAQRERWDHSSEPIHPRQSELSPDDDDFQDEALFNEAVSDLPMDGEQLAKELKEDIEKVKAQLKQPGLTEVEQSWLESRLARKQEYLDRLATVGFRGRPLPPVRDSVRRYEKALMEVIAESEQSPDKIMIICGGHKTPLKYYFRFRFAAQLWSYFTNPPHKIDPDKIKRDRLAQELAIAFSDRNAPDTANALEVFKNCTGKSRWGDSHDNALEKIVDSILKTCSGNHSAAVCHRLAADVKESLTGLQPWLPPHLQTAGAIPATPQNGIDLLIWALRLETDLRTCGPLAELEVLKGTLLDLLLAQPGDTLAALVSRLSPLLGVPLPALGNDNPFKPLADILEESWLRYLGPRRIRDPDEDLNDEEQPWFWLTRIVVLIATTPGEPDPDPSLQSAPITRQKISGFFTQLYAPNQEPGPRTWPRDEWEYLAYRIAFSGISESYQNIWNRVAAQSPFAGHSELTQLYRYIAGQAGLLPALQEAVEACCPTNKEHSS